uniref:Uncharacterized protein n=1 Tax=Physcomitrium patens TaxID=3218 RepID=A0A2K1IPC5_PHYPA|nr:hypothetical protein PHYPA_027448 [Physcomitrium patens]
MRLEALDVGGACPIMLEQNRRQKLSRATQIFKGNTPTRDVVIQSASSRAATYASSITSFVGSCWFQGIISKGSILTTRRTLVCKAIGVVGCSIIRLWE